jgi:PHYB activation tagged suppressor 1
MHAGPKFLIWFGRTPRLTISEPELILEVLVSRAEHFERYVAPPLIRQFEGVGLTNIHGDEWARRRKLLTPAFHTENLKLLVPFVGETVQRMLDERVPAAGGEVEVDVAEWYPRLPQPVITLATFGRNNCDEGSVVFWLQNEHASYAAEAHSKVFIPGYRFIPTTRNRRVWQLDRAIKTNLAKYVAGLQSHGGDHGDHTRDEARSNDNDLKDLMSFMAPAMTADQIVEEFKNIFFAGKETLTKYVSGLQSHGGDHGDHTRDEARSNDNDLKDLMSFMAPAMTADQIVEECKNIFFAGKETLTNLLTWAIVALAMHPEWQDRARREVVAVCGRRGLPTKDHLPKLKTLGMVVNETLRLYPPAVAAIRQAKRDVQLGGCVVPCGTEVLIPIMAVDHDRDVWGDDATEFNPARFAEAEDGGGNSRRHHMAFMPFGGGARLCMGQNLALTEAKVALAVVLQRCKFRLSPAYQHAPQVLMILSPQHGAQVIFQPL